MLGGERTQAEAYWKYVAARARTDNDADGCLLAVDFRQSQVMKGIRRMPRRQEPKKDVVSCEKPGGTASKS